MGYRVLIIEAHEDSRTVLHRVLLAEGYGVRSTGSVAEAVKELGWKPHAIVLDPMLPGRSGLEILPHLPGGSDAPKVVILSTLSREHATVDIPPSLPYFVKPLDYQALLVWLNRELKR